MFNAPICQAKGFGKLNGDFWDGTGEVETGDALSSLRQTILRYVGMAGSVLDLRRDSNKFKKDVLMNMVSTI